MDNFGVFIPLIIYMVALAVVTVLGAKRAGQRRYAKATPKDNLSLLCLLASILAALIGGLNNNSWLFLGPAIALLLLSAVLDRLA